MTNDFVLFPDAASGDEAADTDVALITAYLSGELTPVQILAVQDRLNSDAEFRENVRPIIETWTGGGSLGSVAMAGATSSLTPAEVDAGWQRYATPASNTNTYGGAPARGRARPIPQRRRTTMSRVAAVIAVTVLPAFAVAQIVNYVAKHPDVPGYSLAQRVTGVGDSREGRSLSLAKAKQAVPVVDLPAATATTRTFGAILGIKHTSAGRVLVNDPVRHQLVRLESDLITETMILDSVPGTSKSYLPGGADPRPPFGVRIMDPFIGDSSVFGPVGRAANVIDGEGNIVRSIYLGWGGPIMMAWHHYWDLGGRLVAQGNPKGRMFFAQVPGDRNRGDLSLQSDTVPILRLVAIVGSSPGSPLTRTPDVQTFDTLGLLHVPAYQTSHSAAADVGNGGGKMVPVPRPNIGENLYPPLGPDGVCWTGQVPLNPRVTCMSTAKQVVNPLYPVDDWAMLSDGTLALVRGQDYHIDWVHPDGTKSSSGKLPFEWRRLTDADKQRLVDSTRAHIDSLDALGSILDAKDKPRRDSVIAAARALGKSPSSVDRAREGPPARKWPYEIVPLAEIADYYPPIRTGSLKPDADGNLWISPRTTSLSRQGELVYDVVNPTRGMVQRVRLPRGRSIAGFGKGGVVYLQYGDMKSGFVLERSVLPKPIPR